MVATKSVTKHKLSKTTIHPDDGVVHTYLTTFEEGPNETYHVSICGRWLISPLLGYGITTCLWCACVVYLEDL